MSDTELIDVETLDFSDDQTWLYQIPDDSGAKVDIVDWSLSLDWPTYNDDEYTKTERTLYALLDERLKNQVLSMPDKHKFDSRTYVKPKKRVMRPSIQSIVEVNSNPPSLTSTNTQANKYLTYNKYNPPPVGQILRLKTFNVDVNTDNSTAVKEFALKRRSLVQEDDQADDMDTTYEVAERVAPNDHALAPSKPINIDLSQPAHNLNSFTKGLSNMMNDRGSLNMYQSGESLMRMSPPSLVSSLLMENSGTFNPESLEGRKSISSHRDSGIPTSGRESFDPMMTSMTLSILDEKDMSTSFLSQTTNPGDSLMDSLPPSLVSSVNSSYIVSNTSKPRTDSLDSNNVFSSATFTHLEHSERLLSSRPRHQMYNSYTKRDVRPSESYTKAREEACQIDAAKVLNENSQKLSPKAMTETITLHYSDKFKRDDEKENVNASFEKDDAFYRDMGLQKDEGKGSLNVTLDKQELNEIIQARQKLSLARKALPTDSLPNQVETSPVKTIQSPNQTINVPKKNENASELLSRRRALANGHYGSQEEVSRQPPQRNATFKLASPKSSSMDATVVYLKEGRDIIDINSATLNLIDAEDKTLKQEEWCSQERAMVGSSESTDTGTFSSSSPPDSVPEAVPNHDHSARISSTPLAMRRNNELLNLHNTISPIYDIEDNSKSYTITKVPSAANYDSGAGINTATMVKKTIKRDILAGKESPERRLGPAIPPKSQIGRCQAGAAAHNIMPPPTGVPRKTGLPTSKLRQYSSHKDLRIPVVSGSMPPPRLPLGRTMVRRGVYASNPALSPTSSAPQAIPRRETYVTVPQTAQPREEEQPKPTPVLVRQGTETLRRERPQSQLVQPKDLRPMGGVPVPTRNLLMPAPTSRPYSIAGASQLRVTRPSSGPVQRQPPASLPPQELRPATGGETRTALPRPSRLPAPRRTIRPPSVYSVTPAADGEHY